MTVATFGSAEMIVPHVIGVAAAQACSSVVRYAMRAESGSVPMEITVVRLTALQVKGSVWVATQAAGVTSGRQEGGLTQASHWLLPGAAVCTVVVASGTYVHGRTSPHRTGSGVMPDTQ